VADVSGHGVPAALVASMVKLAFSTQNDHADNPAAVLTAMNRVLARQLTHSFVTAAYAVVDSGRGTLTVANAGHPAVMIARRNRTIEEIDDHGLMLGFMPDVCYTNVETRLAEGDVIFLYTDGVTETRNPAGEFFDRDNVKRWFESNDCDAARLADSALRDLTRWRGDTAFEDDLTFIVARIGRR
jgi:serine phosphatase RsbU (regulator of sigma subunit)